MIICKYFPTFLSIIVLIVTTRSMTCSGFPSQNLHISLFPIPNDQIHNEPIAPKLGSHHIFVVGRFSRKWSRTGFSTNAAFLGVNAAGWSRGSHMGCHSLKEVKEFVADILFGGETPLKFNILHITRWWFQIFFISIPTWGSFPFWRIFFNWVEVTN